MVPEGRKVQVQKDCLMNTMVKKENMLTVVKNKAIYFVQKMMKVPSSALIIMQFH